jgi:protease-4
MRTRFFGLGLVASLVLFGCDGPGERAKPSEGEKGEGEGAKDEGENDAKDDAPKPADPLGMASNPLASLLSGKLDEPGPYDAPKQSAGYDASKPHLRVLSLSGSVGELQSFDPLAVMTGGGAGVTPIRELLDELDELAGETALEGLVLRVGPLAMDMAHASELRRALLEFKQGGRKIHCHTEQAGNTDYYLLSACDELVLAPVGMITIPGPVATPIHVKGMLDDLGVQADFLHVGAFKGAAEPLTRDAPSPEMIETLQAIVDRTHATMVAGIAAGRSKTPEEVSGWIDEALFTPTQAQQRGLVDAIEPWEPFLARVAGERGWQRVELGDSPLADPLALQRFLGLIPAPKPSEPHVAVVHAVGNIIDGKGQGPLGASGEIASAQLVPVLDRMAADASVAALVLRIDSGGGSALASEQIWHAVERVRANKPVVVSMAGVAASGGYYIACGANEIFAEEDTLTGSIGVVGGKLVLGPALERVGITTHAIGKGARANLWSAMQPWSDSDKALVQAMMEDTYETFLARVAAGRKLERDAVHAIAQGRVWTGADAKQRGLVDQLGGLEAAVARARELGKVDAKVELEVYPAEPNLKDILGSFGSLASARAKVEASPLQGVLAAIELALGPEQAGSLASLRRTLATLEALQSSHVWAVEWLEPPR